MKRIANSRLTKENCDEVDEQEDRGSFSVASTEVIAQRKTRTPRRRNVNSGAGTVFKSFTGIGNMNSENKTIDFGIKNDNENLEKQLQNIRQLNKVFVDNIQKHITMNPECILTPLFEDYTKHLAMIKSKFPLKKQTTDKVESSNLFNVTQNDNTKPSGVKSINFSKVEEKEETSNDTKTSFSFGMINNEEKTNGSLFDSVKSIESTSSGFFNLQPNSTESKVNESIFSTDKPSNNSGSVAFSFFNKPSDSSTTSFSGFNNGGSTFGFGINKSTTDNSSEKPLFTNTTSLFGANVNTSTSLFAPTNPIITPATEEEEEYVPPTAESKEIKEEGSVYDCRCKLFFKKDEEWRDKGVGQLFIKPTSDKKFQLVIRADNSLATLLLNILITDKMPLTTNKNNVALVAMTDLVGSEMKQTSLLIRVKTEKDAVNLLSKMKEQMS